MNIKSKKSTEDIKATENACHLCTPLGAALVFKGVEGMIPLIHGSQGCATYMRRYTISHFREPIDIASSNFSEASTIFGGGENLKQALKNVMLQYNPKAIGVATSCLSETIGDNAAAIIKSFVKENEGNDIPKIVSVSSPSYQGDHILGFFKAVHSITDQLAVKSGKAKKQVNVFPSFISPEDIRYLKRVFKDFELDMVLLPDYSETLDGGSWSDYERIPKGGTTLTDIESMGDSFASIDLNYGSGKHSAAKLLKEKFEIPAHSVGFPLGIRQCDKFFQTLEELTGRQTPIEYEKTRGRLVDAYVDGHKTVFGKKVVIYGDEDLASAMTSFATEIGMKVVLVASASESGKFKEQLKELAPNLSEDVIVKEGVDFVEIGEEVKNLKPDLVIGNSKGYSFCKTDQIPLLRVGFPIHDRFGAQRILHIGYQGTQALYDQIVNLFLKEKQEESSWGYSYL